MLPELGGLLREPLITLERVRVCKRDGELLATPHELPGTDEHGMALWQKLMVYTSNSATHDGQPLHLAIVRRLREADAAGATCLRGIWGFHGDHAPARRQAPADPPPRARVHDRDRHARAHRTARSQIIDELTSEHGLVTSEMVPAVTAMSESETHGGLRLANHDF